MAAGDACHCRAAVVAVGALTAPVSAQPDKRAFTFAVIGDIPYGDAQIARFPASGFQPIVREIARRSAAFGKPVYLFNGDSHIFNSDAPLAPGSTWLTFYDVPTPAPNLTRITVDGSTGVDNYLRVTVNQSESQVLTWIEVPLTAP